MFVVLMGCSAVGSALALGEQAKTVNNRFCDAKSAKQGVRFDGLCPSQMTTM